MCVMGEAHLFRLDLEWIRKRTKDKIKKIPMAEPIGTIFESNQQPPQKDHIDALNQQSR